MAEEILAYCVKEKTKKPMKDAHEVTLKNGKRALQGVCSSCGTKMMKFISSKKASKTEEPEMTQPVMASSSSPSTGSMGESSMEEEAFEQEPMTTPTM